jgi:tRNA(fMet)-specific endonuclease VapC
VRFLLDTNACIAVLNGTSPRLVEKIRAHHPDDFGISSVVRAELCYGAQRSRHVASNLDSVESFCAPFRSVAFDDACAAEYGAIRAELEALGRPIGPNDLLIAATARAHAMTLVTANLREFRRVVALRAEDWQSWTHE